MIVLKDPSLAASLKGQTVIHKPDAVPFYVAGGRLEKNKTTGQVVNVFLKDSRGNQYPIADCWNPRIYEIVKLNDKLGIVARSVMTEGKINTLLVYDLNTYKGVYFSSNDPNALKRLSFYQGEVLDELRQKAFLSFLAQQEKALEDAVLNWHSQCQSCRQNVFISLFSLCEGNCNPVSFIDSVDDYSSWDLEAKVRYLQANMDLLSKTQFNFGNSLLQQYKDKGSLSNKQVEALDKIASSIRKNKN